MSAPRSTRPPERRGAARTCRWLAQAVLLGFVLATPWFFGGVTDGFVVWLVGGVGVALVLAVCGRLFEQESVGRLPWVAVPLGLAVLLGTCQLAPLPQGLAKWLSPTAVNLRAELTGDTERGSARLLSVADPSVTAEEPAEPSLGTPEDPSAAVEDASSGIEDPSSTEEGEPSTARRDVLPGQEEEPSRTARRDVLPGQEEEPSRTARRAVLPGQDEAPSLTAQRAVQPEGQPLSVYPGATRADLVLLTLGVAVFALGYLLFAGGTASKWLLILVAINGGVLAGVGLVLEVTAQPRTVLGFKLPSGAPGQLYSPFASFVNPNHAGGYLNMCLAGAFGTLVLAWRRSGTGQTYVVNRGRTRSGQATSTVSASLAETVLRLNNSVIVCLTLTMLIVAAIIGTLSRGAFLGMCTATLLATLVSRSGRSENRMLLGVLAIAAGFAGIAWLGFGEIVTEKLGTLMDREEMAEHSLLAHWAVAVKTIPDYWLTGSGLGTCGYVYGMYQEDTIGRWFARAENQYLQALVDGGIVGLVVLVAALALVWKAGVSFALRAIRTVDKSLATAGLVVIGSQTVCAMFDFGLYAPANLLLMAVFTGAVVGRSAQLRQASQPASRAAGDRPPAGDLAPRWRVLPAVAAGLLIVALGFSFVEARSAAFAEAARLSATWEKPVAALEVSQIAEAIERLTAVADRRPADAEVQLRLGQLWMNLYRHQAVNQIKREAPPGIDADFLWNLTSPVALHGQLQALALSNATDELEALRNDPIVSENLAPAAESFTRTRAACPLLPWVHLRLAELCGLTTDPDEDTIHIERACRVGPGDPAVWLRAGVLNVQAGRTETGLTNWQRCLAINDRYVDAVLDDAERIMEPVRLVDWLLPPKPYLMLRLVQKRYTREQPSPPANANETEADSPTIRGLLLDRAARLVQEGSALVSPRGEPVDAAGRAQLLGEIFREHDNLPAALAQYRKATDLRPYELGWQYGFTTLLLESGELSEARERAGRGVRLAPRDSYQERIFRRLLEQIIDAQLERPSD